MKDDLTVEEIMGPFDGFYYVTPIGEQPDLEHPYDSLQYAQKALNAKDKPELYTIVQADVTKIKGE